MRDATVRAADARTDLIRNAIVAGDVKRFNEMYPEFSVGETVDVEDLDAVPEGAGIDYSGVRFVSPTEDPDEWARFQQLLAESSVTVAGGDEPPVVPANEPPGRWM